MIHCFYSYCYGTLICCAALYKDKVLMENRSLEILPTIPDDKLKDYNSVIFAFEIRYGRHYLRQVHQSQLKASLQ